MNYTMMRRSTNINAVNILNEVVWLDLCRRAIFVFFVVIIWIRLTIWYLRLKEFLVKWALDVSHVQY